MKKVILFLLMILLLSGIMDTEATPLRLDYSVTHLGGSIFNYDFSLILDNNDESWVTGQGWRGLIFGDAMNSDSPLTDWMGDPDDFPVGPWTSYGASLGFHNGPTFYSIFDYWVPSAIGERLGWSGTSTANLTQGDLLFSTIIGTLNGGVAADFDIAHHRVAETRVPEPGTIFFFGSGLFALAYFRKKYIHNKLNR